jgi:hypothetical protein
VKSPKGITLSCVPEGTGFWLAISASREVKYRLSYFVLGAAGHQRQGEIQGILRSKHQRRFVELGFSAIVVGLSDLILTFGKQSSRDQGPADHPIRLGSSRFQLGVNMSGAGRIQISAAARKRIKDAVDGQYGGVYGSYGIHLYGGPNKRVTTTRAKVVTARTKTQSKKAKRGTKR